jgi:hypothetical protein
MSLSNFYYQIVLIWSILLASCLCFLCYEDVKLRSKYRFPPIVPGLPFIGNMLQLPKKDHGPYLRELGNQYGEM